MAYAAPSPFRRATCPAERAPPGRDPGSNARWRLKAARNRPPRKLGLDPGVCADARPGSRGRAQPPQTIAPGSPYRRAPAWHIEAFGDALLAALARAPSTPNLGIHPLGVQYVPTHLEVDVLHALEPAQALAFSASVIICTSRQPGRVAS